MVKERPSRPTQISFKLVMYNWQIYILHCEIVVYKDAVKYKLKNMVRASKLIKITCNKENGTEDNLLPIKFYQYFYPIYWKWISPKRITRGRFSITRYPITVLTKLIKYWMILKNVLTQTQLCISFLIFFSRVLWRETVKNIIIT